MPCYSTIQKYMQVISVTVISVIMYYRNITVQDVAEKKMHYRWVRHSPKHALYSSLTKGCHIKTMHVRSGQVF